MRLFVLFFMLVAFASATVVVLPIQEIAVDGVAKDIVARGDKLYIGTDSGKMQVYNYKTKTFTKEVKFPDIKDFTGEVVPTRVSSLDFYDGRFVMLTDSGIGGYVNIWIHENNVTTKLISHEDKRAMVKVRFIDRDHLLFGYLGNEVALFDIKNKKELYRVQLAPSKFSDFALNEKRTKAVFGCESGVMSVIDTSNGKLLKELKGLNLDNTYKVAFQNGIVSGAGQDRRGTIYDASTGKGSFIEGRFLIYATGLSPSAKKVAFAMDEENNISVYKTSTKSKLFLLKGQKSTLNAIIFIDEDTLVSASDDDTVMMWKLK